MTVLVIISAVLSVGVGAYTMLCLFQVLQVPAFIAGFFASGWPELWLTQMQNWHPVFLKVLIFIAAACLITADLFRLADYNANGPLVIGSAALAALIALGAGPYLFRFLLSWQAIPEGGIVLLYGFAIAWPLFCAGSSLYCVKFACADDRRPLTIFAIPLAGLGGVLAGVVEAGAAVLLSFPLCPIGWVIEKLFLAGGLVGGLVFSL